jgi:hypothetical protein
MMQAVNEQLMQTDDNVVSSVSFFLPFFGSIESMPRPMMMQGVTKSQSKLEMTQAANL